MLTSKLETDRIIAIGSSTGGNEALQHILTQLPIATSSILIVQHMPADFTKSFAKRLDRVCDIDVKEANDKETINPGVAYIAPGDKHMQLKKTGDAYRIKLSEDPLDTLHKPAIDILFESITETLGCYSLGIILSGMGEDGAKGLQRMKDVGALTIAQDESSSAVYGMPKAAINSGGVCKSLPLDQIAQEIVQFTSELKANLEREH